MSAPWLRRFRPFPSVHKLDPDGLIRNLRREGTPDRVYFIELFQDRQIEDEIDRMFGVSAALDRNAPDYEWRRSIAMQRFLGYEWVGAAILNLPRKPGPTIADTAVAAQSKGDRSWLNEHRADIASWEDFGKYPWPDGKTWDTRHLEWLEKNLPDDMFVMARGGHYCEYLAWLMGYETLCYALHDQRDLVEAIARKVFELEEAAARVMLQFPRVRVLWASDDMGFRTGLMISPDDTRRYVLAGHKRLAAITHDAGRLYLLHACGNRSDIIEDLIEDVKLDALHSWEDVIEPVTDAKRRYGRRLSLLGGIDVDFLCRAPEPDIRRRVRDTIDVCQPGGGWCLGTGNSVANYIPAANYLAMLDEGRKG